MKGLDDLTCANKVARVARSKALLLLSLLPVLAYTFAAPRPATAKQSTAEVCRETKKVFEQYEREWTESLSVQWAKANDDEVRSLLSELRRAIANGFVISDLDTTAYRLRMDKPGASTKERLASQKNVRDVLERMIQKANSISSDDLNLQEKRAHEQMTMRSDRLINLRCDEVLARESSSSTESSSSSGSTSEPSGDDWQKAIGAWRNKAGTLVFELVDMNKADREYHPDEPIKVEGYFRKVPPTWSNKIHAGGLIFISNKVEGSTLSGTWIQAPQKGDCPKMAVDYSSCTLRINTADETLTSEVESKQYAYPKCQWSDKVISQTFTYYRVK